MFTAYHLKSADQLVKKLAVHVWINDRLPAWKVTRMDLLATCQFPGANPMIRGWIWSVAVSSVDGFSWWKMAGEWWMVGSWLANGWLIAGKSLVNGSTCGRRSLVKHTLRRRRPNPICSTNHLPSNGWTLESPRGRILLGCNLPMFVGSLGLLVMTLLKHFSVIHLSSTVLWFATRIEINHGLNHGLKHCICVAYNL